MKRKFSFDIPRIKIGPSKADNKALRDHLAVQQYGLDSPPVTPKSVRPPLPPLLDAELRSACAYVLQNFKPSHVVYEEQYGGGQKQQLDYAAIKESVHREMEESTSPLSKVNTRAPEPDVAVVEDDAWAEKLSPNAFRYKPESAAEDLFRSEDDQMKQASQRVAVRRVDQLMSYDVPKGLPATTRDRSNSHLRSMTAPNQSALVPPTTELVERPRTAPRIDSVETTGSTPPTDATDSLWSEKASTAMTSAAATPARSSKRASSQALQSGSEASSVPRVDAVSAEWMRQELEKHRKAEDERLTSERTSEDATTMPEETTPTQTATQPTTPNVVKMPTRKPVPSRSASRPAAPRSDSAQSLDLPRSESRAAVELTPAISPTGTRVLRSESRQGEWPQRASSRARSITRQVKDYVRQGSAQRTDAAEEIPRSPSRGGNVTRQVRELFRPATSRSSRNGSVDLASSDSRSRSIDSYRSAVSELAPSVGSSSSKWRTWKPLHRRNGSQQSPDVSRPGTSGSATEGRGRASSRDNRQSPQQQKAKPAVNLNRELPPLPGLDQWKPEDDEEHQERPQHGDEISRPVSLETPTSHQSHVSRPERHVPSVEPEPEDRHEIVAAIMGSPTSARSGEATQDGRRIPPHPVAPPPAPPLTMGATIMGADDFDFEHFDSPVSPLSDDEPSLAASPVKKDRRRSRSIQAAYPADFAERVKDGSLGSDATEKPIVMGKAQLVNYSRVAGGPINGGLSRKISKAGHVAATALQTPAGHSRTSSGKTNFSRKFSMDSHYRNMVEISVSNSGAPPVPPKDKTKAKWWKRKDRKQPNWMDEVVKSGSRSGVLLTDEVAGAPIVRY